MNFLKLRPLFYFISLSLLTASLFSIVNWGFKPSIDFAGGTIWEIGFSPNISQSQIETVFSDQQISLNSLTPVSSGRFILKFANISQEQKEKLLASFQKLDPQLQEYQFETLSPILGRQLIKKTIIAIFLSCLVLFLFINSRFKQGYFGLSAILAMLHDSLILLGAASLLGHFFHFEIDTLFVTAILTTLSASVHDTVVTFDRIRELKTISYKQNLPQLASQAVKQTLVRSFNNSMTIIFMLLALVLLGGDTTRSFAIALLIGAVLGTYSSLGVAVPLLLLFSRR